MHTNVTFSERLRFVGFVHRVNGVFLTVLISFSKRTRVPLRRRLKRGINHDLRMIMPCHAIVTVAVTDSGGTKQQQLWHTTFILELTKVIDIYVDWTLATFVSSNRQTTLIASNITYLYCRFWFHVNWRSGSVACTAAYAAFVVCVRREGIIW